MKVFGMIDMGTTNTRISFWSDAGEIVSKKASFGARNGKAEGRDALYQKTRERIQSLLREGNINECDVECILISGMGGSEMGLMEIPHTLLPSDIYTLADHLVETHIPEIINAPFVFVPGLKKENGSMLADIMRGEETETMGILSQIPEKGNVVLLLPGTHNKIVCIDQAGAITDFYTTLCGELIDSIVSHTILSGAVSHSFAVSDVL